MKSKTNGFNFVELFIVLAIGFMLIACLSRLVVMLHRDSLQLQTRNELYNEANTTSQILKQELEMDNHLHCLPPHYATTNFSHFPATVFSGVAILNSQDPALINLLPPAIIKKIQPNSAVIINEKPLSSEVAARLTTVNQLISNEELPASKDDLLFIHDCQSAWLIKPIKIYHHNHQTDITIPQAIPNATMPLSITTWQQVFWFSMKNSEGNYGLYRFALPDEKSPDEIISHVANFQASVLKKNAIKNWQWQNLRNGIDWQQVAALRIHLTLSHHKQMIDWPTSIVFT